MKIKPPSDKHFVDCEDSHAMEIYQSYSYFPTKDAEPTVDFFLGIAPELDCNLDSKNIQTCWEEIYGKAEYLEVQDTNGG